MIVKIGYCCLCDVFLLSKALKCKMIIRGPLFKDMPLFESSPQ